MNRGFKTVIFAAVMTFVPLLASHAIPGVKQYIPDSSGEYVFYRDNSFRNESYVGFLYYNEETYAVRFYSPANEKNRQLEIDITLYVTVDSSKKGLQLTGERIDGTFQGNMDIINYLHDLLYEFSSRRVMVDIVSADRKTLADDFLQFGGAVSVVYNPFVPLFNIEQIKSSDGKPVFQLETMGYLASSTDTSFSQFKGMNGLPKDKKRVFKKKPSKDLEAEFNGQKVALDTQWKKSMDNLWLLDDYAILSMNEIAVPDEMKNSEMAFDMLVKRFSLGTNRSYSVWNQSKTVRTIDSVTITNVFFQPDSENVTRDFKVITKRNDGTFVLLTFTIFDSVYQKSRFYFDTILKSYRAKALSQ